MKMEDHFEIFYAPPEAVSNGRIRLQGEEFQHLARVKRKRIGDTVYVSDGEGRLYTVAISEMGSVYAIADIVKTQRNVGESLTRVTLAQGIIRSQRMDWIIEKGTELGVRQFIPVKTAYSLNNASEVKHRRWVRLARAAMKQCGRSVLPEVTEVIGCDELADKLSRPVLFAHPGTRNGVAEIVAQLKRKRGGSLRTLSLLVGPEGGFSTDEIEMFKELGFHQVDLGKRRLRSETAAIVFVSLVMNALSEL